MRIMPDPRRGCGAAALGLLAAPAILLAAEAEKHEPGIINLDKSMLLQVVNLLILLVVLRKFLFKPLVEFLAKRAYPAMKEAAEAFSKARGVRVEVTAGPTDRSVRGVPWIPSRRRGQAPFRT